MRLSLASTPLALLLVTAFFASVCAAQPAPEALIPGLTAFTSQRLNLVPSEDSKLFSLGTPLFLPSIAFAAPETTRPLAQFWSIPRVDPIGHLILDGASVSSQALAYFTQEIEFELGYAKLNAVATERLDSALDVLYADPDGRQSPTERFERYRDWQTARNKLVVAIQTEQNMAKKLAMNMDLSLLDQDYKLTGEKEQVETALEIVGQYTTEAPLFKDQFAEVRAAASDAASGETRAEFLRQITSTTAWTRLTSTVNATSIPETLSVTLRFAGTPDATVHLTLVKVSYQGIVAPVRHLALSADIFGNRAWRRKDKAVFSDGLRTTGVGERVPIYLSNVVVIKDLDLEFSQESPEYREFADRVGLASAIQIGALSISLSQQGAAYLLPGHLYVPRPLAIAAVVTTPDKAPDEAADLEWR